MCYEKVQHWPLNSVILFTYIFCSFNVVARFFTPAKDFKIQDSIYFHCNYNIYRKLVMAVEKSMTVIVMEEAM